MKTRCCSFIDNPASAFPEGLLVSGRLLAPAGGSICGNKAQAAATEQQQRLEMTLRCGPLPVPRSILLLPLQFCRVGSKERFGRQRMPSCNPVCNNVRQSHCCCCSV